MIDYLYLFLAIICFSLLLWWLSGFIFGAPYQPSSDSAVKKMMKLANVKKGEKVADLGSGNGKIVIEFAKKGADATGFEINPVLVWLSRWKIKKLGLQKNAKIIQKSFWDEDLGKFDIVSSFQIWHVMPYLEKKLKKELKKKNARVVSNTWRFRDMKPSKTDGHVYLYKF